MKNEYSFRDGGIVYIFAVASIFLSSLLLSMVVNVAGAINGQDANVLLGQNWALYLNTILSEVAFFLVYFIYSKQNKIKKFSIKNVNKSIFDWRLLIVFVLSMVVFFGSLNFTTFFNTLFLRFSTPHLSSIPLANFGEFLLSVLCFALVPAIAEELVFRGVIFSSLKTKTNAFWAVVISSVAFTLIHLSIFQTIHQFLLGLALSLIFYFTGKIVYSMFFHFLNNFFVLFFVYVTGNENFGTFSSYGTIEIVLTFVIFAVCVGVAVLLFYLLKRLTKKAQVEAPHQTTSEGEETKEETIQKAPKYGDAFSIALYIATTIFCVIFWIVNSFKGGI